MTHHTLNVRKNQLWTLRCDLRCGNEAREGSGLYKGLGQELGKMERASNKFAFAIQKLVWSLHRRRRKVICFKPFSSLLLRGCFLGSAINRRFGSNRIGISFKDWTFLMFFPFLINLRLLLGWSSWMKEREVNARWRWKGVTLLIHHSRAGLGHLGGAGVCMGLLHCEAPFVPSAGSAPICGLIYVCEGRDRGFCHCFGVFALLSEQPACRKAPQGYREGWCAWDAIRGVVLGTSWPLWQMAVCKQCWPGRGTPLLLPPLSLPAPSLLLLPSAAAGVEQEHCLLLQPGRPRSPGHAYLCAIKAVRVNAFRVVTTQLSHAAFTAQRRQDRPGSGASSRVRLRNKTFLKRWR